MPGRPDPMQCLTPAQLRVYRLVRAGRTSREIAGKLNLSLRTVENHRARICRRLGLSGPHALLQFALRGGRS